MVCEMSKKVIKLEKEDFTPENIKRAFNAVCMKKIRAACQLTVAEGMLSAFLERKKENQNESNNVNETHS